MKSRALLEITPGFYSPKKVISKSELNLWARTSCVSSAKLQTARSQPVQIRIFFLTSRRLHLFMPTWAVPFHTFSYNIPAFHKSLSLSKIILELTGLFMSKMSQKLSSSVTRNSAQNNSFEENSNHLNHNVLRNFKYCCQSRIC